MLSGIVKSVDALQGKIVLSDVSVKFKNTIATIYEATSVANLADDGSITVRGTMVNVDANGSARTGIRFGGTGTLGQFIMVHNSGGENLSFHNTPATAKVDNVSASRDTIEPGATHAFISNGTTWYCLSNMASG